MKKVCGTCNLGIDHRENDGCIEVKCAYDNQFHKDYELNCEFWQERVSNLLTTDRLILAQQIKNETQTKKKQFIKKKNKIFSNMFQYRWFMLAIAVIGVFFMFKQCSKDHNIEISYEAIILDELQEARDYLAFSILANDNSWTVTSRDTLWYKDKVPEIFNNNIELTIKIQRLYKSLSTGLNHVRRLSSMLRSNNQNKTEVKNIVCPKSTA